MIARLLACWAMLAVLMGAAPTPVDTMRSVAEAMWVPGLHVKTLWAECGEPNAFYSSRLQAVVICDELLEFNSPGLVRIIYAHELAHAIIDQLDIPFTGNEEAAADELAAWVFTEYGWQDDLVQAAQFFFDLSLRRDPDAFDEHPGDLARAVNFLCFAEASRGRSTPASCPDIARVRTAWQRLLTDK